MILFDSNIRIDHLRAPDAVLSAPLSGRRQRVHPFVMAELALGILRDEAGTVRLLQRIPQARVAKHGEVMWMIDEEKLLGLGIC